MTEFFKKYEKEMQEFGLLTTPKASQKYLVEHMDIVCEHLASYLVVWCVDLAVEGESQAKALETVSHQCICAQFIMELAKSMKTDPRSCVNAFFARMTTGEAAQSQAFKDELASFRARVAARAKVRLAEAEEKVKEEEAAEREARIKASPGGECPGCSAEGAGGRQAEAREGQRELEGGRWRQAEARGGADVCTWGGREDRGQQGYAD